MDTEKKGIPITHSRVTIPLMERMKSERMPIAALSIYDACHARLFDRAGGDVIVVGDSAAMTMQGKPNTKPMTMDEMIMYTRSVRNGTQRLFVIGDMPLGSYEVSNEIAIQNAARFMRETDCNAVKVETNKAYLERIEAIAQFCPVVLHAGLNPNKAEMLGGYRTYGKTLESVQTLIEVSLAGEKAGACMIVLESVTEEVSQKIRELVHIPVIGIAAGRHLDGQLLISYDLLGLYEWPGNVTPRHFKVYHTKDTDRTASDVILEGYSWYVNAVKKDLFPDSENVHFLPEKDRKIIQRYFETMEAGTVAENSVLHLAT